jgi:chorismate mutase
MTSTQSLQELRDQIDAIDDALQDLLQRRAGLVQTIAAAKAREASAVGGQPPHPMRPGREAQILRRLAARHEGALPLETLIGIWRALIAAMTGLQAPIEIAVFGGAEPMVYWDLARAHFGPAIPMSLYQSANQVLRAIGEDRGVLGVLPLETQKDGAPWWPYLLDAGEHGPAIVARLPFMRSAAAAGRDAMLVGALPREASGADSTFLVVAADASVSRGTLVHRAAEVGLSGQVVDSYDEPAQSGRLHLMRVDGFLTRDDPRLERLVHGLRPAVRAVSVIGSYADPLDPERPVAEAAAAAS